MAFHLTVLQEAQQVIHRQRPLGSPLNNHLVSHRASRQFSQHVSRVVSHLGNRVLSRPGFPVESRLVNLHLNPV